MGFLAMPHKNTVRAREDVFNMKDGVESKCFQSLVKCRDEYCEQIDIPTDTPAFFMQANDEVYTVRGMKYIPATGENVFY